MIIINIIIIIDYIDAIDRERLSEHRNWALIIDNNKHLLIQIPLFIQPARWER